MLIGPGYPLEKYAEVRDVGWTIPPIHITLLDKPSPFEVTLRLWRLWQRQS